MKSKKIKILILTFLSLIVFNPVAFGDWVPVDKYDLSYPIFISGTKIKGVSNITEPQAQKGEYLEVVAGGVILIKRGAAFFLKVKVIKKPQVGLYFKIEYPNPIDPSNSWVNDAVYDPSGDIYIFSSPDVVPGLAGYGDYLLKISVYESRESEVPLEVIKQKVRSYVDTRTNQILIFKKVLSTIY